MQNTFSRVLCFSAFFVLPHLYWGDFAWHLSDVWSHFLLFRVRFVYITRDKMWNITDTIYHSSSLSSVSTPFNISLISIFLLPSLFSWCEIKSFYLTLKLNSSSWSFHLRHHFFASPGCTQANVYGCCLRDCVLFYTSSKFTSVFLLPRLLTGSWINIIFLAGTELHAAAGAGTVVLVFGCVISLLAGLLLTITRVLASVTTVTHSAVRRR